VFFLVIAIFASRDDVSLFGFAAPDHRNDVIHGQGAGGGKPAAVMATATIQLAFPPLGLPQFLGLLSLPVYGNLVRLGNKETQGAKPLPR
jgi:hypothetical protein